MKTPYFIVYPDRIAANYRLMASTLPVDRLYYATKANGEAPTLSALAEAGAGFEIVCADEMEELLALGVKPENIICSLPIKTAEEIARMYALGCRCFVYDSEGQYELLQKLSPEAKKIVRLQLRFVSPHDLVYGLYPEEIADMARRGKLPDGYTFYIFERDNWVEKLNGVFDALEELMAAREDGSPLLLNLGGHYVLPSAETAAVFDTLRQRVARLRALRPGLRVIAEPGGLHRQHRLRPGDDRDGNAQRRLGFYRCQQIHLPRWDSGHRALRRDRKMPAQNALFPRFPLLRQSPLPADGGLCAPDRGSAHRPQRGRLFHLLCHELPPDGKTGDRELCS